MQRHLKMMNPCDFNKQQRNYITVPKHNEFYSIKLRNILIEDAAILLSSKMRTLSFIMN